MSNETAIALSKKTVAIDPLAHKKATLASTFTKQDLTDFVTEAVVKLADPVLKKHGLNPERLEA